MNYYVHSTYTFYVYSLIFLCAVPSCTKKSDDNDTFATALSHPVNTLKDMENLFPKDVDALKKQVRKTKKAIANALKKYIRQADSKQYAPNFLNTVSAFDSINQMFINQRAIIQILGDTSPDEHIRKTAHNEQILFQEYGIEHIYQNRKIYQILNAYYHQQKDTISKEKTYAFLKIFNDLKRNGLNLPETTWARIKELKKELALLEQQFQNKINDTPITSCIRANDLTGISNDFISSLPINKKAKICYTLSANTPTINLILSNCTVEKTRHAIWQILVNRAYPENMKTLEQIIKLRHELATLLGCSSWSAYDLTHQMAKNSKTVKTFLKNMHKAAQKKLKIELKHYQKITQKTFDPWNWPHITAAYKKELFDFDQRIIAEYFPLEDTLTRVLDLIQTFFGIIFKMEKNISLWHPNLKVLSAYSQNNKLIGYIIFDLFPREHKSQGSYHLTIIEPQMTALGVKPSVAVIVANFPTPTNDHPALLLHEDVITLFHELGHAAHTLFGIAPLASASGTNVAFDFLEIPSQLFEEFAWEPLVIKKISTHYKTKKSMPDRLIKKISALKNFDSASKIIDELVYAFFSCLIFEKYTDPEKLFYKISTQLRPHVTHIDEDHSVASFDHLIDYGTRYYSYLWSKVYALDLFEKIKEHGIFNKKIGKEFAQKVLAPGGSKDPYEILENFLGRKPHINAFCEDTGFCPQLKL